MTNVYGGEKNENRLIFGEDNYGQEYSVSFFDSRCS